MILKCPELLAEFRQARSCEYCNRATPGGCDPHHFWRKRGMGGGSRIDHRFNLVSLCRGFVNGEFVSCHDQAERGVILRSELLEIVAKREKKQPSEIIAELERIRNLPKGSTLLRTSNP